MAAIAVKLRRIFHATSLVCAILALTAAAAAAKTCPQTSLPDIEDEVMCVVCGTPLGIAGGPQANDQRDFIRDQISSCASKDEIKTALVAQYGKPVLAVPDKSGFELSVYLVPILAAFAVVFAGLIGITRWRRQRPVAANGVSDGAATGSSQLDDADEASLRADLEKYDL